ncbi:MAG TPA: hypothetical protein GXX36_15620 [Clostridiaceae bacterium]|nr:hypothetical protein [Clostridiaceae bacterium]
MRYTYYGQKISVKTRIIVGIDGASSKLRNFINKDVNVPEDNVAIQE